MSALRRWIIRFEVGLVSAVLLATFILLMMLVVRHNRRWDLTQQKLYSFSSQTVQILRSMQGAPLDVLAFYPAHDENKNDVEIFLKEAAILHGKLHYRFYDPQKQPALAAELKVRDLYTVILRTQGREERVVLPDEEAFATALLRLKNPAEMTVCLVTGHGESEAGDTREKGLSHFSEALKDRSLSVRGILLAAEGIPSVCRVVMVPGPQKNWTPEELELTRKFYALGGGVIFLLDPMDKGAGNLFEDFMKTLGIHIASNVIVDKMSRAVGGDFLVPFVNQYNPDHPLTRDFHEPTFFPIARTVEPLDEKSSEALPIAFSGSNSWAETNLKLLEQGEAVFEMENDTPGPLSVAVAVTPPENPKTPGNPKSKGRMVVIGDSDFVTNAYLDLSANRDFALRVLDWTAHDERVVRLAPKEAEFVPFAMTSAQRAALLAASVAGMPLVFFAAGAAGILWRRSRA